MSRPITLFTGQWADLSFEDICKTANQMAGIKVYPNSFTIIKCF